MSKMVDARELPQDHKAEYDLCIVGAGAAGITIAREFINRGTSVCLLESGGLQYDADTQALYNGENIGTRYDPLNVARLRFFGGTTNHWEGWCRPLDALDFERRDWIANSGWPITRADLDPYYLRAQHLCQVGHGDFMATTWTSEQQSMFELDGKGLRNTLFRFSPPTRFGEVYRDDLDKARNVSVYLHANVVELQTDGHRLHGIRVSSLSGNRFTVVAKAYVLATGGIENARLLLASNQTLAQGIGNANDLVGRYFADHVGFQLGAFLLADPQLSPDFYREHGVPGIAGNPDSKRVVGALGLSPETLRREGLANMGAIVQNHGWSDVFSPRSPIADIVKHGEFGNFAKYISDVFANFPDLARAGYRSVVDPEIQRNVFSLVAIFEPVPNRDSRVTLGAERDALGMPTVRLDWQMSDQDRATLYKARQVYAHEFGRNGLGRMMIRPDEEESWPPAWFDFGRHHMGTTRMHRSASQGVVNEHCRMHEIDNLYVAGSSVFPTYGFSQPTLTIVALAVRLADHLKGRLT